MESLKALFGWTKQSIYKLKFSKSEQQWQVYKEDNLMYLGSKEACEVYITNMTT